MISIYLLLDLFQRIRRLDMASETTVNSFREYS